MKRLRTWGSSLLLPLLMALALAACGSVDGGAPLQSDQGGGAGETIQSLQVTPAQRRIPVELEQQFIALATMSDGSVRNVTHDAALHWSSSNAAVATITAKGLATGIAPGTAFITASSTANGVNVSATATLTVISALVTALQVTPAVVSLPVGFEQPFTATAFLSDGSSLDVTHAAALSWSSSDPAIASINSGSTDPSKKGLATGLAAGAVIITASGSLNGNTFSATAQLTVTGAVVTALQITPATASIPVGLEQSFTATAFLSDGSSQDVTNNVALSWSSSNAAIATITAMGRATGIVPGTTNITASGTAKGVTFSATAELTVTSAVVTALQVTPATASIPVGLEQSFTATAFLSDGSSRDVTNNTALNWSSSNAAAATITGMGRATGIAPGNTNITASGTAKGVTFSATVELTVTSAVVTALQVTPAVASVPVGLEQPFTATAILSDGSSRDVTNNAALSWSSSNAAVATITAMGRATGIAPGTTSITAVETANGVTFSATAELTVTSAVVTALQVTPAVASVPVGLEQPFTATVFLSDGSSRVITNNAALSWSSSNAAVATITALGRATGIAPGTTSITAVETANGVTFSATAELTVTSAVVTALQVTPTVASVPVGFEQTFTATALLSDGSSRDVTNNAALSWSSSNTAVATITALGRATGIAPGTTSITAVETANGVTFSATAVLTVTSAVVTALQVTPAVASVPVGLEQSFNATVFLSDGSSRDITNNAALSWSSSNPAIATIASGGTSNSGLATGVTVGNVIISASGTANGTHFSAKTVLTVTNAVVTALQVTPATASIPVGLEQSFVATAFLSDGSSRDITNNAALSWSSSNPAIATIASGGTSNNGLATGVTVGNVIISASGTANGTHFSAKSVLTVTNAVVTALQVTPATAAIPAGFEQPFVAIAFLSDGGSRDVTSNAALSWRSSNPAIATIASGGTSNNGLATGVAQGAVIITATGIVNGTTFSATAQLTVTNAVVTALQVTPATASIPVGLEQSFVATAFLSDGSSRDITNNAALSWSSSNPAIATIASGGASNRGLATGVTVGNVIITASGTANGTHFSATAQLTVTNAVVTALQVTPATATIPAGFEQPFVAIAFLSDGSSRDVTSNAALSWRSSDPAIATVDSGSTDPGNKGLATGIAQGTVIITATGIVNGTTFSATAQLTVTSAVVTALQVTPPTASIPVGFEQSFVAVASLSDGSSLNVTDHAALSWSSSNTSIASITSGTSSSGLATGNAAGAATITATGAVNGTTFSATAALTVTSAVVTGLQITPAAASVPAGFEQSFVAIASLSDGSSRDVTDNAALSWSSSNPAIATIASGGVSNNGLATGIAAGTATITASGTANGTRFSATAALTVTSALVTALQISPAAESVFFGTEQAFVAIALLSDGSSLDVTNNAALSWSSSDPAIATITSGGTSDNGVATGRAEGVVTITASGIANATSFSATAALTVGPSGCDIGSLTHLGVFYICTPTQAEADANGIGYEDPWVEDGRQFVIMTWAQAQTYCNGLGSGYRLPTNPELRDLYFRYGPLHNYAGWPSNFLYWTSTGGGAEHSAVNITNGDSELQSDTLTSYVSCVR